MFSVLQTDYDIYKQLIEIRFVKLTGELYLQLSIYFYDTLGLSMGKSTLNFNIINNEIKWIKHIWLSKSTMNYCEKLLKMKAFG